MQRPGPILFMILFILQSYFLDDDSPRRQCLTIDAGVFPFSPHSRPIARSAQVDAIKGLFAKKIADHTSSHDWSEYIDFTFLRAQCLSPV